jgi:hypothetical protein
VIERTRETFESLINLWRQASEESTGSARTTTPIIEEYAV